MNSAAAAVKFECPNGFSKEDAQSQLYIEDIDDDSELWLVRVPNDMDPKDLENQVISMNKNSEILSGSDGKFYECFPEKCVMPNLCLVLPHKEDRTLEEVRKPFKGSLLVTDYVMDNVVKIEAELKEEPTTEEEQDGDVSLRKKSKSHKNNEDLDISFNLNLEDDDHASSSQQKTSKKSKKKKSKHPDSVKVEPMEAEENEQKEEPSTEEEQDRGSSLRRKSKSHKNNKDLDLSFNSNIDDNDQASPSQQKASKKSKKKKSKHSDSVKVEPMSDADEFPNCKSQKK